MGFWCNIKKRANKDTLHLLGFDNYKRLIVSAILAILAIFLIRYIGGGAQMSEEIRWVIAGIGAATIFYVPMFLWNFIKAPSRIEKEVKGKHKEEIDSLNSELQSARSRIQILEDERIPHIEAKPFSGRRLWDYEHQHLMWAELEITNTNPILPLKDVEVQVRNLVDVMPKQDEPNKYLLYPVQPLNPTGVCWSERFASPNQLKLTIPPNSIRSALIAFSNDSNGMWTVFNALGTNKPRHLGGARIEVEVSSPDSALWRRVFYIECHPNYLGGDRAKFEFVEWDKWAINRNIIP